jgi:hypothetical protein
MAIPRSKARAARPSSDQQCHDFRPRTKPEKWINRPPHHRRSATIVNEFRKDATEAEA